MDTNALLKEIAIEIATKLDTDWKIVKQDHKTSTEDVKLSHLGPKVGDELVRFNSFSGFPAFITIKNGILWFWKRDHHWVSGGRISDPEISVSELAHEFVSEIVK